MRLYGSQALAPGPTAVAQSGAAAFGGIAVQKAMLAFAPDFRRLILAFHVIIFSWLPRSSAGNTPARGESALRSLKRYRQVSKCQSRKLAHRLTQNASRPHLQPLNRLLVDCSFAAVSEAFRNL